MGSQSRNTKQEMFFDLQGNNVWVNQRAHLSDQNNFDHHLNLIGKKCQVSVDLRTKNNRINLSQIHLQRILKNL